MYSHHPPDVVTWNHRHHNNGGTQTPETDSPLSTTPNSPRSPHDMGSGAGLFAATANLLQDLVLANKESQKDMNAQLSPIRSKSLSFQEDEIMTSPRTLSDLRAAIQGDDEEEPFDQGSIPKLDEKKEGEAGDELMGKQQPQWAQWGAVKTTLSSSLDPESSMDVKDDDVEIDDNGSDESQPPSLAVDRSLSSEMEEPLHRNSDKLLKLRPFASSSGEKSGDPEDEMAAMQRLLSSEPPLSTDDNDLEPEPFNTTVTSTPIQQLRSPPKVLKQSMAWDIPPMSNCHVDYCNKTSESSSLDERQYMSAVSPSPEKVVLPDKESDNDDNDDNDGLIDETIETKTTPQQELKGDDVPIDETKETETPNVLRPMISPDGKVESPGEEQESDIEEDSNSSAHLGLTPVTAQELLPNPSPLKDGEKATAMALFHPQGAVAVDESDSKNGEGTEKPTSLMTRRSISAPALATKAPTTGSGAALDEFRSTLSDAVDLAALGAASIVGDFVNGAEAVCGTSSRYTTAHVTIEDEPRSNDDFIRPKSGFIERSVTDMPRTSEPMSSNDWNKYLQNYSGGTSSTASDGNLIMDVAQWLNTSKQQNQPTKREGLREMTPKRDFQSSEKSAAWLQEEFKRRSTMKEEINNAILARNYSEGDDDKLDANYEVEVDESVEVVIPPSGIKDVFVTGGGDASFATALSKALAALPQSLGSSEYTDSEGNHQLEDNQGDVITITDASLPGRINSDDEDVPTPRRLDYGSGIDTQSVQPIPSDASIYPTQTAPGQPFGVLNQFQGSPDGLQNSAVHLDYHSEMLRFANDTRAALRENKPEQSVPKSQFRSLAISSSVRESIEEMESFHDNDAKTTRSAPPGSATMTESSQQSDAESSNNSNFDLTTTPVLVHSMDSNLGIAKGDITLSLLNENTGQLDTSPKATWPNRVHSAIWRSRRTRRSMGSMEGSPLPQNHLTPASPLLGRSSLPVDTDKARVAGGIRTVQSTQDAALGHLKHDEIDEAMELFEDIIFAYYSYFEKSLKAREANPGAAFGGITDFRPYIGVALHNLGILNLLKGEYKEAVSYFGRAVDNRKACLGEGHPDHVASLAKLATCLYALNEFAGAHEKLEEALLYARRYAKELGDRMQMAEILNNLGCLAYMCGQPGAANRFYRESLDVQFGTLSSSLYLSSAAMGQAISLNISITRANIGFVKLLTRELPVAVTALENALMEQQLLVKGANSTIIATMDHLAVANLLNGDPEKAAMMFGRILDLQQKEYGAQDRRCYVTADKINMVNSRGTAFEQAMEELRKTFSIQEHESTPSPPRGTTNIIKGGQAMPDMQHQQSQQKNKSHPSKVMKVFTSIRKKKAAN